MKLCIRNIGKIENATIEINGITVIGGENNTGKSTVGKSLFSLFNSFYEIQRQIYGERILSIKNILEIFCHATFVIISGQFIELNEIANKILSNADNYMATPDLLKEDILSIFHVSSDAAKKPTAKPDIDNLVGRIIEILQVPDEDIFNLVVNKKLYAEFNGQLLNVDSQSEGRMSLQVQDEELSISVTDAFVRANRVDYSLHTEAVYIDDPLVIDKIAFRGGRSNIIYGDHQDHLIYRFFDESFYSGVIDEIVAENKFKNIYEKLTSVCEGNLIQQKNGLLAFQRKNSETPLSVSNLSTGLKTFVILKTLLENGVIETNGTIILDEPEIHLHPEWQLLFAEIIVLLNKEFGLNILLNTHSPYFLRAIQVYSAKYERGDVCKYYLSELDEKGKAYMTDVTNNVDKIFAKLAEPLQTLEDERWKIEND